LKLNISAHDNALDLHLAANVAHFFRQTDNQAQAIIQNTLHIVSKWRQTAKKYKISKEEQDRMSGAFYLTSN